LINKYLTLALIILVLIRVGFAPSYALQLSTTGTVQREIDLAVYDSINWFRSNGTKNSTFVSIEIPLYAIYASLFIRNLKYMGDYSMSPEKLFNKIELNSGSYIAVFTLSEYYKDFSSRDDLKKSTPTLT
jgi:hypothetical protein